MCEGGGGGGSHLLVLPCTLHISIEIWIMLTHSLLKMPGGTYLGYSRHLYRMSICCSFMKST